MKFAIYHPWIYLHGGLERTMLELVKRSRHEWVIFAGYYDKQGAFPGFAQLDVRTLRATSVHRGVASVLKSSLQVAFQKIPLSADVQALVVCCDGIGDLVTFRNTAVPSVNLCFTPLRAAFDPIYEKKAISARGLGARTVYYAMKYGFRFVDRIAWARYRNVIAISQEVKNRIVAGGLYPEDKIVLAHPGVDWPEQIDEVAHEPIVLVAGRIMWTKNIELAIRAFVAANPPEPWRLVIAGFLDKKSEIYLNTLQGLAGGDKRIEFVLSPSDAELKRLYQRASFTLFTPLNEDWGIAPIEAMCWSKPVVAIDAGGPKETIVHGHSGYLLPPDVAAWGRAIAELIEDPERTRRLGRNAREEARRFRWENFVTQVDDLLEICVQDAGARVGQTAKSEEGSADFLNRSAQQRAP